MTDTAASFARDVLQALGLPAHTLEPAESWSSRVWLAPAHVVRLASGRFRGGYAHERAVLRLVMPTVPHAHPVAHGYHQGREWLVLARAPGRPLGQVWGQMNPARRQAAVAALGDALRALHAVALPPGFHNPWLAEALAPGGHPENAYHAPPASYPRLLAAAAQVPGVDWGLLDEIAAFVDERLDAFADDPTVLVHSDVHFANVLWEGDNLTAVLDFEGARPAAPDLELDTLLRFAREPEIYRGPTEPAGLTRQDLAPVPGWLADAYPELFAHPRLPERLEAYEALWHLVQLLHFPPGSGPPDPWGHLAELLGSDNAWARW